jgi:hypothetical protein
VFLRFENQISSFPFDAQRIKNFWEGSAGWKTNVDNRADDLGNGSFLGHEQLGE